MDTKYLEVTVKNEQTQLVRINDVIIVEQGQHYYSYTHLCWWQSSNY